MIDSVSGIGELQIVLVKEQRVLQTFMLLVIRGERVTNRGLFAAVTQVVVKVLMGRTNGTTYRWQLQLIFIVPGVAQMVNYVISDLGA